MMPTHLEQGYGLGKVKWPTSPQTGQQVSVTPTMSAPNWSVPRVTTVLNGPSMRKCPTNHVSDLIQGHLTSLRASRTDEDTVKHKSSSLIILNKACLKKKI